MYPYFYELSISYFSEDEKYEIIEVSKKNEDLFIRYKSIQGVLDGNELWKGEELSSLPCVNKYLKACTIECFPMFVRHSPGAIVIKHVDEPNKRDCVIAVPLLPKSGYAPTAYFNSREEAEPVAIARFPNLTPCLLNTQQVHGLINRSNETRLNFQFAFNKSFDHVKNLIEENKLFVF
jgi:hypothetical protein